MKLKYIYLLIMPVILGIIFFTAFKAGNAPDTAKGNKALIKFSHKLHAGQAECTDCHSSVPKSTSLNDRLLPGHNDCGNCHDVTDKKNCTTCHFKDVYEPLIQPVSQLKFNHSIHVNDQKMKCLTCHKGVDKVEYAEDAPGAVPAMETCYSCHNGRTTASNECTNCHISTANLVPQSHKNASFIHEHKFAARAFDPNCVMCHDNTSCQECHTGATMITGGNSPNDFPKPSAPSNFTDGVKQQKITRVHNLNYVYTHGIDAKGKTAECQSCHQIETFCARCHQAKNADYSMGGVVPMSHLKPSFMVIGVGSGGGDHATLARRDIESCAACHDVQGGDPTCIKCHMDPDGIQGTNPRTHPPNYMKDVHGDWHSSQGSICFNCHTGSSPSSPPGVGFCGYCHGSNVH